MLLYLSGPMTGLPDMNAAAFRSGRTRLRVMKHTVRCLAEFSEKFVPDPAARLPLRRLLMCQDLIWITTEAEGIVVLDHWQRSPGAYAEVAAAKSVGLPVWPFGEFSGFGFQAHEIEWSVYA